MKYGTDASLFSYQVPINRKKKSYPMKDRRLDFLGFFSGNSLILCMEALPALCEVPFSGATLSDFRLPGASGFSCSLSSDFLVKGRSDDSLSDRGFFTACTSSDTEQEAMSFWRAAETTYYSSLLCILISANSLFLLSSFSPKLSTVDQCNFINYLSKVLLDESTKTKLIRYHFQPQQLS